MSQLEDQSSVLIRVAEAVHLADVHALYEHHVVHGTGSFEEVPPSIEEVAARWRQRESRDQPTLVALADNRFAGFAYAASHKERSAYRFTVEDSVYVSPDFAGRGVGRALLEALIETCSQRGFQQMMAVIGDSENHGSIALHKACGFRHVGTAVGLGYKFGQWLDIVYMQRSLR